MNNQSSQIIDTPGSFIEEELETRGWSQVDLAYILGIAPQQLNPILKGKRSISPEMALALGDAFHMPAEFFTDLQRQYDLSRAKRPDPGVRARASWQAYFPVREMIRRGWIEDADPALLDLQMLRFFQKNAKEDVPFINGSSADLSHAAKKSDYSTVIAVQYTWLHRVRHVASAIDAPLYSQEKLRASLNEIRSFMVDPDGLAGISGILLNCGVRFALVEALPGAKIDGVCLWIEDQPVIGMTTRLDRLDNFCFVLRHEIEHILRLHGLSETYAPVDEFDAGAELTSDSLPYEERTANSEALEFCIPQDQIRSFYLRKQPFISERDVIGFAARMEVHPSIVVGQIQHRTKQWNWLRKYLVGVRKHLVGQVLTDGWGYTAKSAL